MAEAKSAIDLVHVSKAYPGEADAVNDVSLSIREGEFIVLVGPSGCGKSSVLRMIAGLESPSRGKLFLHGKDASRLEPKDRDIAMVFQTHALYPHMTVRENREFIRRRKSRSVSAKRLKFWIWIPSWTGSRSIFPEGSGNALLWGAPWCGSRRYFSLTNRFPVWMPK